MKLCTGDEVEVVHGPSFGAEELQLVEMDEAILEETLTTGVHIKGGPDDEAVLCTSRKTFALKFVGSSNTIFVVAPEASLEDGLLKEIKSRALVTFAAPGYLELVETAPRLELLKELLSRRVYNQNSEEEGPEQDSAAAEYDGAAAKEQDLFSSEELLEQVQASEYELHEALDSLNAVEVNGKWRVVDEKYLRHLLDLVLLTAVQHDWPLSALPEEQLVSALHADGVAKDVVRHCLKTCARMIEQEPGSTGKQEQSNQSRAKDEPTAMDIDAERSATEPAGVSGRNGCRQKRVWALQSNTICLHRARQLLAATGSKWRLEDFMEAWAQDLPEGMKPDLKLLQGEALEERLGGEVWLRPFSAAQLPSKPAARFDVLFQQKPRWLWEELEPYLRNLKTPCHSIEALLLKFTRKSQPKPDQPPVYSKR